MRVSRVYGLGCWRGAEVGSAEALFGSTRNGNCEWEWLAAWSALLAAAHMEQSDISRIVTRRGRSPGSGAPYRGLDSRPALDNLSASSGADGIHEGYVYANGSRILCQLCTAR